MKKVLIVILVIILIPVLVIIGAGIFGEKQVKVERSIKIDAPAEVVFRQVQFLENHEKWSPWAEKDPNQTVTITGEDGTVGARSSWKGDITGEGYQEIKTLVPNQKLETDLVFTAPWEDKANAYIILTPEGEGTTVLWGFTSENGFMEKAMGLFMNMDEMLGPDYEKGLENLKKLSESAEMPSASSDYKVNEKSFDAKNYVGIRTTLAIDDEKGMQNFFTESYGKIMTLIQSKGMQPVGAPSAIYYKWDMENNETDFAAVIPVQSKIDGLKGDIKNIKIENSNALLLEYYGDYSNMEKAHNTINSYMQNNNFEFNEVVIEEYITDPSTEQDPNKWQTNIYYLVVKG